MGRGLEVKLVEVEEMGKRWLGEGEYRKGYTKKLSS